MCAPIIAAASIVATAASTAYSATQAYQQGQAEGKMYDYQSELTRENQRILKERTDTQAKLIKRTSETNISQTQDAAARESQKLRWVTAEIFGKQKAAMGTLGIGGVTATDIIKDTIDKSVLDQQAIRYNADLFSWEYAENAKSQIWKLEEEAKYGRWSLQQEEKQYSVAAKNARTAGKAKMVGSLLEGAASISGSAALMYKPTAGTFINTGKQSIAGRTFTKAYSPRLI